MVVSLDEKRRLSVPPALAPAQPGDQFDASLDADEDSYIAATAPRDGLTIVTGNEKDFSCPGLKVFNPFKELPPE